jgi:hypothetical protein
VELTGTPVSREVGKGERETNASPRPASQPPRPMLILPAMSSAHPPKMTTRVSLNADSPAVSANGTVSPSDNPMMASEIVRASSHGLEGEVPAVSDDVLDETDALRGLCGHSGCVQSCHGKVGAYAVGSSGEVSRGRPLLLELGKSRFLTVTMAMVVVVVWRERVSVMASSF